MIKIIGGLIITLAFANIAFSFETYQENLIPTAKNNSVLSNNYIENESPTAKKFDKIFKDQYPKNKPGASVLISKGNKIILKKGYGLADVEHDLLIKPHMTFRLGSLTKQFTAVAILMLERDGFLKVTDNINTYLPDYPTHGEIITIENLLTHTSGIFNMTSIPDFMHTKSQLDMNTKEIIDLFKDLPLDFKPGSKMSYSNSGYILLGAIIEKLADKSYAAFIKEEIFDPLGMENSHYGSFLNIIPYRVKGYSLTNDGFTNAPYLSMSTPFSAGALVSNTEDMLKWHKGLMSGQILSLNLLNKAWSSATLSNGEKTKYGYGWGVNTLKGSKVVRHSGAINGFNTSALSLTEDDVYVIILSNLPRAADIDAIAEQAALDLIANK